MYSREILTTALFARKTFKVFLCAIIFVCIFASAKAQAFADTITWDGGGADNNWSTCANWFDTTTSVNDVCPTSTSAVVFNSTSTKTSSVDAGFAGTITSLSVNTGYTGTITLARSLTLSSTLTVSAGTLDISTQTLTVSGTTTVSGGTLNLNAGVPSLVALTFSSGTLTMSSGTTSISGALTFSGTGTFSANGGTVNFTGTSGTLSCNNVTFNLVTITNTSAITIGNNCSIPLGANPTISNGGAVNLNGTMSGTGTLTLGGASSNLSINTGSTLSGFTAFNMTGTNPTFSANGGNSFPTFTSFTGASGNLIVGGSTFSLSSATTVTIGRTFTLSSGTFTAPSGTMTVSNINFTGGTFNANGGTMNFLGGTLNCNNVTFNAVNFTGQNGGVTITVNSNCTLPLGANPSLPGRYVIAGTLTGSGTMSFSSASGTITFNAGATLSGFSAISNTASDFTVSGATLDWSAYSSLTMNGNLTVSSGSLTLPSAGANLTHVLTISGGTFTASSGTTSLSAALTISGTPTFNANGGTFDFTGTTATLSCNNVTFNSVNFTGQTGVKTVNSNCTLPLGANPTIPNGIILNGTLTGSGTITETTGTLTMNSGATITGLTGLTGTSNLLTISGATADFTNYTTFTIPGTTTVSSGSLTLPSAGATLAALTVSGGTLTASSGTTHISGALTISGTPTFSANGGTVDFNGGTATLACNNVTFNLVTINSSGTKTINSDCTLPLGSNPTISATQIILNGTLTGTGQLTSTFVTMNSGSSISGFSSYVNNGGGLTMNGGSFSGLSSMSINNSNLTISGATLDASNFTTMSVDGSFILSSGTFTAPTGTMTVGNNSTVSNFTHSGGVFNANGGTVVLNRPGSQTLSGTTTFNNLTKNVTTAATLTFPASTATTVTGALNLQGASGQLLSLRSSSTGTQWNINPQGTRTVNYLSVQDSNNTNATRIDAAAGTGNTSVSNNTGWNFFVPTVGSLGPSSVTGGTYITTNQPSFTFTTADSDSGDTVQYRIIISTHSDFTSPVVDYTSALATPGSTSFTVGQAAGGGTYNSGASGQVLGDSTYYWEVKSTDFTGESSAFSKANSGAAAFSVDAVTPPTVSLTAMSPNPTSSKTPSISGTATDLGGTIASAEYQVDSTSGSWHTCTPTDGAFNSITESFTCTVGTALADGNHTIYVSATDAQGNVSTPVSNGFTVDTTAPTASDIMYPGEGDYINTLRPTFKWHATTDAVTMSKYRVNIVENNQTLFSADNIPVSPPDSTDKYETSEFVVTYQGFESSDISTHYITITFKSSSDWSAAQNDGALKEGANSWTVVSSDEVGNTVSSTRNFTVDITPPTLAGVTLRNVAVVDGYNLVTNLTSALQGTENDNIFPYQIEVTFKKQGNFFGFGASSDTQTFTINSDGTILSANFALTPKLLDYGKYDVEIVAIDRAGNRSKPTLFQMNFLTDEAAKIIIAQKGGNDQNALDQLKQQSAVSLNALQNDAVQRRQQEAGNLHDFLTQLQGQFLGLEQMFAHSKIVRPAIQIAQPLVLLGLLPLTSLALVFSNLTNTSLSWNLLIRILQAIGLLPKDDPEGIVYDGESNAPVPFAVITVRSSLKDALGTELYETLISDVHGVYTGVGLPPGSYTLEVRHTDYRFPTQKARPAYLQTKDFYKGETFSVAKQHEAQFFLIPGDRLAQDLKTQNTRQVYLRRALSLVSHISQNVFIPSALLSFAIFASQINLWNGIMAAVYGAVILFKCAHLFVRPTFTGLVKDQAGRPMQDVLVRLTNPENNQVVEVTRSDARGRYRFFSKKHLYRFSVTKQGYKDPLEKPGTFTELDIRKVKNTVVTLAPATLT